MSINREILCLNVLSSDVMATSYKLYKGSQQSTSLQSGIICSQPFQIQLGETSGLNVSNLVAPSAQSIAL
jgi:hypothetical protein